MWWLKAKKWFKVSSAWCRQHWRWLIFGFIAVIMYWLGNKSMRSQLLQSRLALKSYKAEKEAIEAAHQKEVEGIKAAQATYNKALAQIDQQFSSKTDALSKDKEKQIKQMVKKAKKDPSEIDRILEEQMGIKKS